MDVPVFLIAASSGLVVQAGFTPGGGNVVSVLGPKWRVHYHAHLKNIKTRIGDFVSQGSEVGTVGSTSNAVGKQPHLHYAIITQIPYVWLYKAEDYGFENVFSESARETANTKQMMPNTRSDHDRAMNDRSNNMETETFNNSYYAMNQQDKDRPALHFYARLAKKHFNPGRVLDFGCGTGFLIRRLVRFFSADGFEVSSFAVAQSRNIVPNTRVFTVLGDIPCSTYSGIIALHVLEHISDQELADICSVWRKALLPGGKIICVMPELEGMGHKIKKQEWAGFKDPTHINLKNKNEWLEILNKHGFIAIHVGTDGLWDFPYSQNLPYFLDLIKHAPMTVIQFLAGRLLLKAGRGESLILVLEPHGQEM